MERTFKAVLKRIQRAPRRHAFAALFSLGGAVGLVGAGCADSTTPDSSWMADAGSKVTVEAESSVCTPTSVGAIARITFSTAIGCDQKAAASHDGTCPLEALTLNATSETDRTTGVSTTNWTVARAGTMVVTKTVRSSHGTTATEIAFGPEVQGVHEASFVDDGTSLNGRSTSGRSSPSRSRSLASSGASSSPTRRGSPSSR